MGVPTDSQGPTFVTGYAPANGDIKFDLNQAKKLLADVGMPNGFSFTVEDPGLFQHSSDVLAYWQADLAKIGVQMKIESVEQSQFYAKLQGNPPQVPVSYLSNMGPDFTDVWSYMWYDYLSSHVSPSCCDYSNYLNPKVDGLINAADAEFDGTKRQGIYQQLFDTMAQDVPMLQPFNFKSLVALRSNVTGYSYNISNGYQYIPYETMTVSR